MPDGEWIRELLESVGFGLGSSHLAQSATCPDCNGTRLIIVGEFSISCTTCSVVVG